MLDQLAEWLLGEDRQPKISYRRMSKKAWDPSKIKGKPRRLQKKYRTLMQKIRKAHTLEELALRCPGARKPAPTDTAPQEAEQLVRNAQTSGLAGAA